MTSPTEAYCGGVIGKKLSAKIGLAGGAGKGRKKQALRRIYSGVVGSYVSKCMLIEKRKAENTSSSVERIGKLPLFPKAPMPKSKKKKVGGSLFSGREKM